MSAPSSAMPSDVRNNSDQHALTKRCRQTCLIYLTKNKDALPCVGASKDPKQRNQVSLFVLLVSKLLLSQCVFGVDFYNLILTVVNFILCKMQTWEHSNVVCMCIVAAIAIPMRTQHAHRCRRMMFVANCQLQIHVDV